MLNRCTPWPLLRNVSRGEPPLPRSSSTMPGAFAEFERPKIMERTTRGRLRRLRMGEMSSNGTASRYDYVRKTPTSPAALVINEEQAAVVRSIFEMFASGNFGVVTISRCLEERRVPRAALIILGLMGENNPPHR
jgi:site-specific DNA recombinase